MSQSRTEHRFGNREIEPHQPPVFEVSHFSYTYPYTERPALTDITFQLQQGEVLGIVGNSGSGKSTLLNAMSGIIPHFYRGGTMDGTIQFDNESVADASLLSMMQRIGIVFQNPGLQSFGMPVEQALAFGMENQNIPRPEMQARIRQITHQLKIPHLIGRSTLGLSGGESQAIAIGSMLAMQPEVLLFDEVISALDAGGQKRIKEIINYLREQNSTMVVVDSDITWLADTVDRLLVLDEGRLTYNGDPLEYRKQQQDHHQFPGIEFRETEPTDTILGVKNVTFGYDTNKPVVEGISLDIQRGKCTALVGHNGSGKSTMAKIMAGILRPQSGGVHIDRQPISGLAAEEAVQRIGYLFQNPAQMFVSGTVAEELAFTPKQIGRQPIIAPADVGLDGLDDTNPFDLSAGQQQRLALGCVLAADPDIIILDEPTLGQTRQDRDELVTRIQELEAHGKTIILISHDMSFIAQAAQQVHVMDHGRLVRSGTAKKILADNQFFTSLGLPLPWQPE